MLTNPQTSTIPLMKRLDAVFYQMRADRQPLTIDEVCKKADCFPTEVFRPAAITHYRIAMQYVGGWETYRSEVLDRVRQVLGRMVVKDITPGAVAAAVGLKTRLLKEDVPEVIDLIEAATKRTSKRIQTSGMACCWKCKQQRPIHKTVSSQMWGKPALLCLCSDCA
jgi:hypothetical protein